LTDYQKALYHLHGTLQARDAYNVETNSCYYDNFDTFDTFDTLIADACKNFLAAYENEREERKALKKNEQTNSDLRAERRG